MGTDSSTAAASQGQAQTVSWTKAVGRLQSADGDLGWTEERHSLGDVTPGNGMCFWHDLLASDPGVASAGVLQKLPELLFAKLREADQFVWSRAIVDSPFIQAVAGWGKQDPIPLTDANCS